MYFDIDIEGDNNNVTYIYFGHHILHHGYVINLSWIGDT